MEGQPGFQGRNKSVKCEIDPLDRQTVRFMYPNSFFDTAILQEIRLEIGALADNDLLARVVAFKDKFYRCPWARYDLARRGTMRLMPPEYNIAKFRDDYEHMQNMIFGEKPKFDTILSETQKLENVLIILTVDIKSGKNCGYKYMNISGFDRKHADWKK